MLRRAAEVTEDFHGDVDELARLIREAWADGASPPPVHTPEMCGAHLAYPGAGPALAPSIYDEHGLAAFVAGHPRAVALHGVRRRLLISTLLSVAPRHRSSGYGIVVWSELMRRARENGFDGVINYCVAGEPMDRMITGSCRALGLQATPIKPVAHLVKFGMAPMPSARLPDASIRGLVDAAARLPAGTELRRLWTEAEADWQLRRPGAVSAAIDGAVLTGAVVTAADTARTRYLVVGDVLWDSVDGETRARLLGALLATAAERGATVAVLPLLGYCDVGPFFAAGFRPSGHTIHAYLTLWSDGDLARAIDRYYLDVV